MADRGRHASTPGEVPPLGWKDAAIRAWKESTEDNVGLISAGVAFYAFLAIVPLLAATVLTYGLFADMQAVARHVPALMSTLPQDAAKLIEDMLVTVVKTSSGKKGAGLLFALALALFSARNAAGALVTALNIAYEEKETRGFLRTNLLALAITAAAVVAAVVGIIAVASVGYLHLALPDAGPVLVVISKIVSYAVLALFATAAAAALYRFGPNRDRPQWLWLTPGSILFAVAWVLLTLGFGFYAAHFGNYGATYGALSAVVVLLTWIYLSAYALLFGGELNSELEHQTARDTTSGPERPLGERGAWAADHVAGEDPSDTPLGRARPSGPADGPRAGTRKQSWMIRAGAYILVACALLRKDPEGGLSRRS